MTTIKILPEILSNQIAAGEVVERPVSVVKELVENSIDAGADQISIEVKNGGKSLIRVSDNGVGLSRDDALLAIERYATSKIYNKDDLFSISTMGFRGEALPSIASVSKLNLITRTNESDIGTRIEIAGGKIRNVSDVGAPEGTMVEVKGLFYNTPARKKFLKSEQTEISHIADAVSGMALGHSDTQFKLVVNNRSLRHYPGSDDLFLRTMNVLGKDTIDNLYPVSHDETGLKLSGFCVNPMVFRSTGSRIYLFVNNRLIHDRGLISAIFQGYRGSLMKGKFPLVALFVEIDYDQVDVNVHPSKKEIRFFDHQKVYQAVSQAVANALAKAQQNQTPYFETSLEKTALAEKMSPPAFSFSEPGQPVQKDQKIEQTVIPWDTEKPAEQLSPKDESKSITSFEISENSAFHAGLPKTSAVKVQESLPKEISPKKMSIDESAVNKPVSVEALSSNIIGQVMGTYIIVEQGSNLILIDQHAAHERIVYESLLKRHAAMEKVSQQLLVPETLELNFKEADALNRIIEDLGEIGLRIEPFGGTTFVIKAVPSMIDTCQAKPILLEIIESILETGNLKQQAAWLENSLITMACHGAIRANNAMNRAEMVQLLKDLEKCDNPMHCPHGRPTRITMSRKELEKLFKRVV